MSSGKTKEQRCIPLLPGYVPSPRYFANLLQDRGQNRASCVGSLGGRTTRTRIRAARVGIELNYAVFDRAEAAYPALVIQVGRGAHGILVIDGGTRRLTAYCIEVVTALQAHRQHIVHQASLRLSGACGWTAGCRRAQIAPRGSVS